MKIYPPQSYKGKLIVIDGIGGVGKSSQTEMLVERLIQSGYKAVSMAFPRYEVEPYGPLMRACNDNKMGNAVEIDAKLASLPYALDRLDAKAEIEAMLDEGKIVVLTRYMMTNLTIQGAKLRGNDREDYLNWLLEYEYDYNGIPREDLFIYLHAPAALGMKMTDYRQATSGVSSEGRDGYEKDESHIVQVVELYQRMAQELPYGRIVNCANPVGDWLKPKDVVAAEVWEQVKGVLG